MPECPNGLANLLQIYLLGGEYRFKRQIERERILNAQIDDCNGERPSHRLLDYQWRHGKHGKDVLTLDIKDKLLSQAYLDLG
jgi:hypothetical protein